MQLLRTWLFVPAHKQRMIDKALRLRLDVVILDLEDGVPSGEKETAREQVAQALGSPSNRPQRFVRVHSANHPDIEADLRAVVRAGLNGLLVPKVNSPDDVMTVDAILSDREAAVGLPLGSIQLAAMIESARGLIHAPGIAVSCPRLIGLMFGAEDFAHDLGIFGEMGEFHYARAALVIAAASGRLQAIDRVYVKFQDTEGLRADTKLARQLGFTGKALIHPGQIEIVEAAFRPTAEDIAAAQRIVEASADVGGSIAVDGSMVDPPIVERAKRLLETATNMSADGE